MAHGTFAKQRTVKFVQEPAPTHGGKINYETFVEGLQQIGYDGYLVSEYCLPMIKDHKICGMEEIDKATPWACAT